MRFICLCNYRGISIRGLNDRYEKALDDLETAKEEKKEMDRKFSKVCLLSIELMYDYEHVQVYNSNSIINY